jgi:hypothetical protein
MVLLVWSPAEHLWIGRNRGTSCLTAMPLDGQRRRITLAEDPGRTQPRAAYPGAAAQTRVVSLAAIRLGSSESARAFKGIATQSSLQRLRCGDQDRCRAAQRADTKKALGRRKRPRALGLERVQSLANSSDRRQPAIFGQKKPSVLHRGLEADRSLFLLINAQIAASYMARAGPVSSGGGEQGLPA